MGCFRSLTALRPKYTLRGGRTNGYAPTLTERPNYRGFRRGLPVGRPAPETGITTVTLVVYDGNAGYRNVSLRQQTAPCQWAWGFLGRHSVV